LFFVPQEVHWAQHSLDIHSVVLAAWRLSSWSAVSLL
jgi:hypothetical protein